MNHTDLANPIWNIANLLRGEFKPSEYGPVILPFTLPRRLECMLEPPREAVLKQYGKVKNSGVDLDLILPKQANAQFDLAEQKAEALGDNKAAENAETLRSEAAKKRDVLMQVSEKLRKNETVMDQVQNNSREQALKADLPQAANDAIVEALSSHNEMATRLLSDQQTRDVFVTLLYEILTSGTRKEI